MLEHALSFFIDAEELANEAKKKLRFAEENAVYVFFSKILPKIQPLIFSKILPKTQPLVSQRLHLWLPKHTEQTSR